MRDTRRPGLGLQAPSCTGAPGNPGVRAMSSFTVTMKTEAEALVRVLRVGAAAPEPCAQLAMSSAGHVLSQRSLALASANLPCAGHAAGDLLPLHLVLLHVHGPTAREWTRSTLGGSVPFPSTLHERPVFLYHKISLQPHAPCQARVGVVHVMTVAGVWLLNVP